MAQGYYKLYERLEEEPHGKTLNYFLMLLLGSFAFAAMVSTRLVPFLLRANDSRVVLAIALVLLFLYILQEYYFRHIHFALPGDFMLTRFPDSGQYLSLFGVYCFNAVPGHQGPHQHTYVSLIDMGARFSPDFPCRDCDWQAKTASGK